MIGHMGDGYSGGGLLGHFAVAAVLVYPLWRVFQRAGLQPLMSLFIFVPGLGWLIVVWLLALLRWPALPDEET